MSTPAYGIKEQTLARSELERHAEEVRINGYTVFSGVLDSESTQSLAGRLDSVYEIQLEEIGGAANLRAIHDENIVRLPLAYDEAFLSVATNLNILSLVKLLLGDYYILLMQNGVINPAGDRTYQAAWHRDLNYQHFTSSRPLAVSVLFCLDEFSDETGGTRILPGTHKVEAFPSEEFLKAHAMGMSAKAGSAFVFDAMVYHRGGHNKSGHARRGLNHVYGLPFLKQQINIPDMLQGRYSGDASVSRLLGYDSNPAGSVLSWRQKRLPSNEIMRASGG
jgi:ectoine hydroxylase-related dioxygenase (phytanoyl-CoA dioxygenase family)